MPAGLFNSARMRALCAALILLLGWLSVPASLAAIEPDVCSMECCVTQGHCCCTPHHARVKGEIPGDRDEITEPSELTSPCPSKCAATLTTSQTLSREVARTQIRHVEFSPAAPPQRRAVHFTPDFPGLRQSPPRAPPVSLT